jgi:hypothetical protein
MLQKMVRLTTALPQAAKMPHCSRASRQMKVVRMHWSQPDLGRRTASSNMLAQEPRRRNMKIRIKPGLLHAMRLWFDFAWLLHNIRKRPVKQASRFCTDQVKQLLDELTQLRPQLTVYYLSFLQVILL